MLKFGLSIGILPAIATISKKAVSADYRFTPAQTKGPFYPIHQQQDKDPDLTKFLDNDKDAKGTRINVAGRVLTPDGTPLSDAAVEIWQADVNGRYRHVRDPNPAPLDSGFQGWGITRSDDRGHYRFITIVPGAYPAGPGWMRPPHIHFKIVKEKYRSLITQMYFPKNPLNDSDLILQNLSEVDQQMVISRRVMGDNKLVEYVFDIVLKPDN